MQGSRPGVAVVGTGALASALARRLAACGYPVAAIFSRDAGRAEALAHAVAAPVAATDFGGLPADVSLIFCCVPDGAIGAVARQLRRVRTDWAGTVVAHTSGALTAAALYGLDEQGAALLSFHPLQSFTPQTPPDAFEEIYIGLEGDAPAVRLGADVARALGAHPLRLAPEAKARYHLAASMASNFFVTLLTLAGDVLADAGLDHPRGAAILRPLIETTWRQMQQRRPEDAHTGPIARGDGETVQLHLDALARHLPHLTPLYAALGAETVRLATRRHRLDPAAAQRLLDVLLAALDGYDQG